MDKQSGAEVRPKMSARRWLAAGGVLAVVAGAITFVWTREHKNDAALANASTPLACTFTQDERRSYNLVLTASTKVDSKKLMPTTGGQAPAPIQEQRVGMHGKLHMRVLETNSKVSILAFSLDPSADAVTSGLSQAELEQLKQPVAVKADAQCRFTSFGFGRDVGPAAQNEMRGILQSAQVVLAADPLSGAWQHIEHDLVGRYGAKYVRDQRDPRSIRKVKFGYVEVFPPQTRGAVDYNAKPQKVTARVRNSDTRVQWAASGGWLDDLASTEQLQLMVGDHVFAFVSTELVLKRLPEATLKDGPTLASLSWVGQEQPPAARPEDALVEPPDVYKTMSIEQALAQALTFLRQNPPDHAQAGYVLAFLMRAQPGMIEKLMEAVRGGQLPDILHSAFFFALERTGTPAARGALVRALDDVRLQPENRMRAAAALADLENPDEATLAALDRIAAMGGKLADESHEQRFQNAATFAIGTLEHNMRLKKPKLAEQARSTIRDHLRKAGTDPVGITAALDAIHNSGHPEFLDDLNPYFKSDTLLVRKHAYEAMQRMPPDVTAPLFEGLLNNESEAQQRALLAVTYADQARAAQVPPPLSVWGPAATRLSDEDNSLVRASYVHLIGAAAGSSPDAVAALADQYRRESDPRMLKAIGRYVPADKLPK
jgi:hypothetical protein